MKELLSKLHSIGAVQFALPKDLEHPFHFDFRGVISHPQIAKAMCEALWRKAEHLKFDLICGSPLVGQALATHLAWEHDLPLVIRRMDIKEGEIRHAIEGSFKTGQRCLVISDYLNSTNELLSTCEALQDEGLEVRDTLSFIDLEMEGRKKIKMRGFSPHQVLAREEMLQILFDAGKIPGDVFKFIEDYFEEKSSSNGKK